MSNPIESFLTAVEKRLEAATPGKKTVERYEGFTDNTFRYEISDENCLVAFYEDNHKPLLRAKFNAELYASAHFDLEKAVKALRVALREMEKHHGCCNTCYSCPSCDMVNSLKEIESVLGEK